MAPLRLFIAFAPPQNVVAPVREVVARLRAVHADVRWEDSSKYHATIKFLGDTPEDRVDGLIDALSACAALSPPLSIAFDGLGVFPNPYRPRVVWAGITDADGTLDDLHRLIDRETAALGFAVEEKLFRPHLTLGKIKGDKNVVQLLDTLKTCTLHCGPEMIGEIEIVRSILHPHGSTYTTLRSFPLSGPGPHRK